MSPYCWLVFKLSKGAPSEIAVSLLGVGVIGTFFFLIGSYSTDGFHENEFFPSFGRLVTPNPRTHIHCTPVHPAPTLIGW